MMRLWGALVKGTKSDIKSCYQYILIKYMLLNICH